MQHASALRSSASTKRLDGLDLDSACHVISASGKRRRLNPVICNVYRPMLKKRLDLKSSFDIAMSNHAFWPRYVLIRPTCGTL